MYRLWNFFKFPTKFIIKILSFSPSLRAVEAILDGDDEATIDNIVKAEVDKEDTKKTKTSQAGELRDIEMGDMNRNASKDDRALLKKAHPDNIKCEGCGNLINFVDDYDQIICYKCPIMKDQMFYFHDTFCVVK